MKLTEIYFFSELTTNKTVISKTFAPVNIIAEAYSRTDKIIP